MVKPLPTRHDTVSVLGMGRSGRALVTHFVSSGIRVYAYDDAPREKIKDTARWLSSLGVPLFAGGEGELRGSFVFRTPAIRPDAPRLCRAALRGAVIMGEAEYFAALCPAPIYAISGSDGKTTTATMTAELLRSTGKRVYLGGNIGRSLLPFLSEITREDACVLELSSFQLMDMEGAFHRVLLTNLTPNHLNWHKDFAEYAAAKERLLSFSSSAVLPKGLFPAYAALRFSLEETADFMLNNGVLYGMGIPLCPVSALRLSGRHNAENLLAAAAMTADAVPPLSVLRLAKTFGGVRHRMELVGSKDGVAFYNSSIDTSPSRTAATLAAFEKRRVRLLLGGRGKGLSLAPLTEAVKKYGVKCYLFGETEAELAGVLEGLPFVPCGTMEGALLAAYGEGDEGDVILLSPAATAFDAFVDYEARGEEFCRLVAKILDK